MKERLRSGGLDDDRRGHALEVVERSANAQNQLVSDLLDVSRLTTGELRIQPAQVDLKNLVEMAVEGIRPAANAKSISLHLDLVDGLLGHLELGPELRPQLGEDHFANYQVVLEQHVGEQVGAQAARGEGGDEHVGVEEELHDTSRKTSSSVR